MPGIVPAEPFARDLVGRHREPAHDLVDDHVAVECHVERTAHAQVGQRIGNGAPVHGGDVLGLLARHVERPVDHARRLIAEYVDVRVRIELVDIGGGHRGDGVDVAREQRRHPSGSALDPADGDLVPFRLAAPVVLVGHVGRVVAGHELDELVRPGSVELAAVVELRRIGFEPGRMADDRHRRQGVRQQGIRGLGANVHGVVVDDHRLGDLRGASLVRRGGVWNVRHPFIGECDVARGKRLAVVELDSLAQLELPHQRIVRRSPGLREPRSRFVLGSGLHERVESVLGQLVVRPERLEQRIERRRLRRHRNHDLVGDGRCRDCQCRRGGGDPSGDASDACHETLLLVMIA